MLGQVLGWNHVGITVADLDRSIAFWRDVVGLELAGRGEVAYPHLDEIIGLGPTNLRWAELPIPGGGLLELFQYLEPEGGSFLEQRTNDAGTVHVCLEFDDIAAAATRLREAGVTLRHDPVRIPFGDWEGWWSAYAVTPDGVTLELVQRPTEATSAPDATAQAREEG